MKYPWYTFGVIENKKHVKYHALFPADDKAVQILLDIPELIYITVENMKPGYVSILWVKEIAEGY